MDYGLDRDFIAEFNSKPDNWFGTPPKKKTKREKAMPDRGPGGRFLPGWDCVTKRDSRGRFTRN